MSIPQMSMFGNLLITNEKAPIRIFLKTELLAGYTGSYRISLAEERTGLLSICQRAPQGAVEDPFGQPQLPDLHLKTASAGIENLMASKHEKGPVTEITFYPDQRWLSDEEEFRVFSMPLGKCLSGACFKGSGAAELMIGIGR